MIVSIIFACLLLNFAYCSAAKESIHGSIDISPKTYHQLGHFNCSFNPSSIIDIELVFMSSNTDDQIYFKTPDQQNMNFTKIEIGPSELFYGYLTYTIKNRYTYFKTYPEYGLFNDNLNTVASVSYEISYTCDNQKYPIKLKFF